MEEAPVVVTAATGALGPVVAKLSALLRRCGEYQLRRRTRNDVKFIRSKLKSIHSILWVIWEREDRDTASKELRMEAWRLADDMDDAIDDFIISMKQSNDDGKRFIQAKIQPSPFEDLKKRADDVCERCRNKWKMETAHTTISTLFSRRKATIDDSDLANKPRRVVDPYVPKDISELVGMEEPRDKLIKHLVGEEESTPQLKMACIVGAAGMGKTTLAHLVYEAIQDQFQARAFVSVISFRNMTEVLASILQQVAADSTAVLGDGNKAATAEKHLIDIMALFGLYLVIIDDIWHSGEWETVKESLPENYLGSRIVTTSRVNAINEKWRDNFDALVHEIGQFYYWAKDLISKMVAMNADMVGECFDRGHHIVKMCGDMPLAVACMFSALAKERERHQQQRLSLCIEMCDLQDKILEQVMRNGIQNTPGFEPLVESLELDYNDLSHHMLKTCLLYCSIYPEGHGYVRGQLVRGWIAQGFVCKEEVANGYFEEVVSRGLLRDSSLLPSLHTMMRNYLRCKLREHNFITCSSDNPPSPVPVGGRLCIDHWPASSDAVDPLSGIDDWHHIQSLVIVKDVERVPYKHLEHLRVLVVQGNEALENKHLKDMCGLLRLRHLLLVPSEYMFDRLGINEMPAEIARLQYLETLVVNRTGIKRLPAEIGDLKQLKTLDMGSNKELAELPREMGNLQQLETLIICESKIREQAWEIIGMLKKLKTLDVSQNNELTGISMAIGKLMHLEKLYLHGTGITELPPEIGNLQRLQILNLTVSTITKLPRDIGRLQHLEELLLWGTNVRKIPREIGGLKKLKNLSVQTGILPFEAGQLPKLEGLPKCVHRAWKNSDLMSSLGREILSFQTPHWFTSGDGVLVVGTKHMHIPQWIKEHFNDISSLDIRICKLEERDLKILREMPYLSELTLRFEAVPRQPIAISGAGFAKLKYLTVDSRVPRITFQEGAMPNLWSLTFRFQFYGGTPNTDPVGINHLVRLRRVYFQCNGWYGGDSQCISAIIDVVRKEARQHPYPWIELQIQGEIERPGIAQSSHGSNEASSSGEANEVEGTQD